MTREFHISVAPVAGGWAVDCGGGLAPMLFLSGVQAELRARDLARRLSDNGGTADVLIHDRDQALTGSLRILRERV